MASPKIQRWVDLLAELLSRRFPVTLAELERQIPGYGGGKEKAALRRMFERDKDELRSFGVPIETVGTDEGEIGYRLRTRDFYLPYLALRGDSAPKPRKVDAYGYKALTELAFEPEELEAVAAGATRVRQLGDPILAEHAESALRKLACDLPLDASAGEDTTVVPGNPVSVEVLEELGVALENRKRAEFDYHSMSSGKTSRRTVEACGLFFLNGHWYLAATAGDVTGVRNYRVNRISGLEINRKEPGKADYAIPAGFDLREHARAREAWELGEGEEMGALVEFRVASGAAVAARRLGEPTDRDRVRLFRVRRTGPFLRWLLSFAGDLVPVGPRELVDQFGDLVRETLRHHRGGAA